MRIDGAVCVITGASRGIGLALATSLLEQGAVVHGFNRETGPLSHPRYTHHSVDVTRSKDIREALADFDEPIDVLINNAGVMHRGNILALDEDAFDDLFNVNVKGSWLMLKYGLPRMQRGGIVVQVSSRHAVRLPENPAAYGLTKLWVLHMADLVARLAPHITVKTLCLGPVDTELSRKDVSPEALAEKRKIMCAPEQIAAEITAMLQNERGSMLVFNPRTHRHDIR